MAGNVKDLIVKILVDDADVQKFEKAGDKALNFGSMLDRGAVASAGALAALGAGALFAGDAAAEAEQSQMRLQFALDQFPATADTNAEALYRLNEALALKTQYDDDAYASGQAVLAQYGLTGEQIAQLTPLLGDYAAKTGVDVATAAQQLGNALLGQGRSLKQVGIDFVDGGSVAANYEQILAGLTTQVGGFAEQQGTTATGANAIFKNSLGELWETLGQELLPVMVTVAQQGREVMAWMTENSGVVKGLAIGTAILATAVIAVSGAMKGYALVQAISGALSAFRAAQAAAAVATTVQTGAQWANNAAWYASPVTWIILAIIAAIALLVAAGIWLYENWDEVTKWLGEAWQNVSDWFIAVGDGIATWWNDLWTGIAQWVLDTFGPMIMWVMERFEMFQLAIRVIGDAIAQWWNGLWSGIGDFFASIWSGLEDIVRGAWNGIVGWIESGVNNAINLINGVIRGVNSVGGAVGIQLNLIPNVRIPRLATGGVTLGPQLAMVGDNPGGREAILPLDSPAARDLLGGGGEPTDLSDSSIEKLARALGRVMRTQDRQGVA